MSGAAGKPRAATAADLLGLERAEVVDGQVVHKASPSGEHGFAQNRLGGILFPFNRKGGGGNPGGWWFATEVEIEFAPHEVLVPDLLGWRRDRVPDLPTGKPVHIRPDWVCEILSPSTAVRDLGPKHSTFHKCEVGHYWVVDPQLETLRVHRWHPDGYLIILTAARAETVRAEPFDAIEFRVGLLFGDDPDDE